MPLRLAPLLTAFLLMSAPPVYAQDETSEPPIIRSHLPFSPVIIANNTIYLAGHIGRIPGTYRFPEGGISQQTTQTLNNIGTTLATVEATHADLVRCQVFLADMADFREMNTAYEAFFPGIPPARTTVAVSGLAANASIEIECTGIVGHGGS